MPDVRRVARREVLRNQWLTLYEDDIAYADGSPGTYAVVDKRDFAVVLPYTDGRVLAGRAVPLRARAPDLGVPAGRLAGRQRPARRSSSRPPSWPRRPDCAPTAGRTWVGSTRRRASRPGFDVFLATGFTTARPQREASEADMVHRWFPTDQLHAMLAAGGFTDSNSVAALALFLLRGSAVQG